ncbi:hypothetical protein BT96DRAFT_989424 [Gymnopus androsaceus JB14]|uniref:Uncharacterized protein n=1 Tax=Gymnopus androsaceus JB14 TaxID=1447944 RepID=A0A6A4HY99_9AGAR|nr:hypothetical protein BT96DRAFT_989424 [Gymnopus androsaceus JB14]
MSATETKNNITDQSQPSGHLSSRLPIRTASASLSPTQASRLTQSPQASSSSTRLPMPRKSNPAPTEQLFAPRNTSFPRDSASANKVRPSQSISPEPRENYVSSERGSNSGSTRRPRVNNTEPELISTADMMLYLNNQARLRGQRVVIGDEAMQPQTTWTDNSTRRMGFFGKTQKLPIVNNYNKSAQTDIHKTNKMNAEPSAKSPSSKGKRPEKSTVNLNDSDHDSVITAEKSTHSRQTAVSTAVVRMQEYNRHIRRRAILQLMRNSDLQEHSRTQITDQHIIFNEDYTEVYAKEQPEIPIHIRPIREEELVPYRVNFPEPFGPGDRTGIPVWDTSRQTNSHQAPAGPPGDPDEDPDDYDNDDRRDDRNLHRNNNSRNNDPQGSRKNQENGGGEGPPGGPPDGDDPGGNNDHNSNHSRKSKQGTGNNRTTPAPYNTRALSGIGDNYKYEPKTVSEEECLDTILQVYVDLINYHLLNKPATGTNNAQKTILQNIPRPEFFYGDEDVVKFDTWIRSMVRWLNVADQCGPESRYSESRNRWVITAVDIQR